MPYVGTKKLIRTKGPDLMFWCPGCGEAHMIDVSHRGWRWDGNADAPTISPSVREFLPAREGKNPEQTLCHLFVKRGQIEYLGDCAHAMKGTTIDMQPIPDDYGGLE